ncbi:hypothetical protein HZH68_001122 [Vespula germanica]|uniref:Uncharacterized protein n=1 Tax=Vespula germanica TaxID=30212 RepID=A0A834NV02_VESGE|nr:hypothetical protein HZH68_001122 [Vespula germanica]
MVSIDPVDGKASISLGQAVCEQCQCGFNSSRVPLMCRLQTFPSRIYAGTPGMQMKRVVLRRSQAVVVTAVVVGAAATTTATTVMPAATVVQVQ